MYDNYNPMQTLQELISIASEERTKEMWKMYFRSELSRKDVIGDINCQSILDDIQNEIDCGKGFLKRTLEDLTDEYEYRHK
jgi:hypothetical protein